MEQDKDNRRLKRVMANASLSPIPAISTSIPLEFDSDLSVWICNRIIVQFLRPTIDYTQAQQIMQEVITNLQVSHPSFQMVQVALFPGYLIIELLSYPDEENQVIASVTKNASFAKKNDVLPGSVDHEVKLRSKHKWKKPSQNVFAYYYECQERDSFTDNRT